MALECRKASLNKDIKLLFALNSKCFNRSFDCPAENTSQLINYLKKSIIYLCFIDNKPAGSFSYELQKDNRVELKQIMVLPEYQNKGLGTAIMRKFLQLVRGKKIYTVTHPQNIQALIVYLKLGFQIYGWKDNYYGDGEPRLLMKRNN